MANTEIFYLEESPYYPGKYTLHMRVNDKFPCSHALGSYAIIGARLLNISFADYLRFCRDVCGAEIIGKNTMYPVAYFNNDPASALLTKLLNKLANQVIFERENPDYTIHKMAVDIEYREKYNNENEQKFNNDLINWRREHYAQLQSN